MDENSVRAYVAARELFYQAKTNYANAVKDLETTTEAFAVVINDMHVVFAKDLQELKAGATEIQEKSFGDLMEAAGKKAKADSTSGTYHIPSINATQTKIPEPVTCNYINIPAATPEQILSKANENVDFAFERSQKINADEKKIWDKKLRKKVENYDLNILELDTGIKKSTIWQILKRGGYPSGANYEALWNYFS
jgi:hypothetical protein